MTDTTDTTDAINNSISTGLTRESIRSQRVHSMLLTPNTVDIARNAQRAVAELQEWWAQTGLPWKDTHAAVCVDFDDEQPFMRFVYLHGFYEKSEYYAMMRLAGESKDPFCDPACIVQLEAPWYGGPAQIRVDRNIQRGAAHVEASFTCRIPERVEKVLKEREILRDREGVQALTVVCPTHSAA